MLDSALALTLATGLTVTSTAQASPAPGAPAPAADPVPLVQARPADSLVDAFGVQTHLGYPGRYQDTAQVKEALTGLGETSRARDDARRAMALVSAIAGEKHPLYDRARALASE